MGSLVVIFAIFALMSVGNLWGVQSGDVHVVGGDQGWDAASAVASWAIGRSFRVGDHIWFAYSAAKEGVAELRTREEYESCDTSNPIRMYKGGLDKIELAYQGPRYFVSTSAEVCSKGLRLHVHVEPQQQKAEPAGKEMLEQVVQVAAGPKPSSSVKVWPVSSGLLIALGLICLVGFM